jgi:8-oxo-dGTP pyrophosphatase MutT (NUDIX family)
MRHDRAVPTLSAIKRALSKNAPKRIVAEGVMRQAAVAAILRETRDDYPEILFIRRAEHPKDPWSGHMALPGGRVDDTDKNALDAAMRETREEIALDLGLFGRQIGELSHLMAIAHGKPLPMVILPYVFELNDPRGDPILVPSYEVKETLWVPLPFLADRNNRTTMEWSISGALPSMSLPCYHYEGRTIWGLTLRMIDELLALSS